MVSKLVAGAVITVFVLFLLSVIAPLNSKKKFWVFIQKIRDAMDISIFWFFAVSVLAVLLFAVFAGIKSLM